MKRPTPIPFVLAAAALLAACSADSPLGTSDPSKPQPLIIANGVTETAEFEAVKVCKHGSSANFSFTIDRRSNGPGVDESGNFTLNDGECTFAAVAGGEGADVTVTETSAQSGFQFDHVVVTTVTGANCQNPNSSSSTQYTATVNASASGSSGDGICDGTLAVFYNVPVPPPPGGQGCTPGYWKQSQHFPSWTSPYAPSTLFSTVFENAFPGQTLLQVLQNNGNTTGLDALGRHTVSALLNAASANVNYNLTVSQVITAFNNVFPGTKAQYVAQKDIFAGFNEQTCPLN